MANKLITDPALQTIKAAAAPDQTMENLISNLNRLLTSRRVVLQWIPAHVGVPGNEKADHLAKEGSQMQQTCTSVTYQEAKTLVRARQQNQWRDETDGYQAEKDGIHQLERKGQVTIYRLRTGHCRLHKHMRKLGLCPTALCECGLGNQTPEHILQTCPKMTSRQHFWPEPTTLQTKLWGTAEDLQKTADFVEHHHLRV